MTCWDMRYNYSALAIAILRTDLSADQAINIISPATYDVARLSAISNDAIVKMHEDGKSNRQIADSLGMSVGAVWCRIKRANKKSRQ